MPKSIMVDKRRLIIDGEEIPGLKLLEEYNLDQDSAEISEFDKIRSAVTGVKKIPEINAVYNIRRDTITLDFFYKWFASGETKDIVEIQTDGSGNEVARFQWSDVELKRIGRPASDSSGVAGATLPVTFVPEDIEPQKVRT